MKKIFEEDYAKCGVAHRHKDFLIGRNILKKNNIQFHSHSQKVGEIMILDYGTYHYGINEGPNISMSINYANHRWLPYLTQSMSEKRCKGCPKIDNFYSIAGTKPELEKLVTILLTSHVQLQQSDDCHIQIALKSQETQTESAPMNKETQTIRDPDDDEIALKSQETQTESVPMNKETQTIRDPDNDEIISEVSDGLSESAEPRESESDSYSSCMERPITGKGDETDDYCNDTVTIKEEIFARQNFFETKEMVEDAEELDFPSTLSLEKLCDKKCIFDATILDLKEGNFPPAYNLFGKKFLQGRQSTHSHKIIFQDKSEKWRYYCNRKVKKFPEFQKILQSAKSKNDVLYYGKKSFVTKKQTYKIDMVMFWGPLNQNKVLVQCKKLEKCDQDDNNSKKRKTNE